MYNNAPRRIYFAGSKRPGIWQAEKKSKDAAGSQLPHERTIVTASPTLSIFIV